MRILVFSLGFLVILYSSEARLKTFVPEPMAEYEIRRVWEKVDRTRRILETKKEENKTMPKELLGGVEIKENVTKKRSDTVPIVVGCVLAGLIVVVLVSYFVVRIRKSRASSQE
jgi:hypothetical protein